MAMTTTKKDEKTQMVTKKDGLQVLYDIFDDDGSDELELNEFVKMCKSQYLKLGLN